ncbi:MAG: hypothetical protein KIT69_02745, partial [Propionibacteriaceae bacterium]|nr:hypothetical protein [Propionibacteriaceae bacterium]
TNSNSNSNSKCNDIDSLHLNNESVSLLKSNPPSKKRKTNITKKTPINKKNKNNTPKISSNIFLDNDDDFEYSSNDDDFDLDYNPIKKVTFGNTTIFNNTSIPTTPNISSNPKISSELTSDNKNKRVIIEEEEEEEESEFINNSNTGLTNINNNPINTSPIANSINTHFNNTNSTSFGVSPKRIIDTDNYITTNNVIFNELCMLISKESGHPNTVLGIGSNGKYHCTLCKTPISSFSAIPMHLSTNIHKERCKVFYNIELTVDKIMALFTNRSIQEK